MKWILFLLSFPCWAGSTYLTVHKDMKASTEIMSRASKFIQICSIPVKNVSKGEVLKAHSTMTTTNDTGLVVGVTAVVMRGIAQFVLLFCIGFLIGELFKHSHFFGF